MSNPNRLLVKLLPTVALAAADPRANIRPLFESSPQTTAFGIGAAPAWFMADMPDSADTPWDLAHSQFYLQNPIWLRALSMPMKKMRAVRRSPLIQTAIRSHHKTTPAEK
jgi:hypothetical protein